VDVDEALAGLAAAWDKERQATRARFIAERRGVPLATRVARGIALRDVSIDETQAVAGQRTRLWLMPREGSLDHLRIGPGDPVRLWWEDPDGPEAVLAIAGRREAGRLAVVVDGEPPERLDDGGFHVDRDAPEVTFERGARAIGALRHAKRGSDEARLAALGFGDAVPTRDPIPSFTPFDAALEDAQRLAVGEALAARDLFLIHGPPGTGKTRTLVEVIRQAVARGEKILVTAASHTAVDNLAERLAAAGLPLVRLGHPARVSPAIEARTLDALVDDSEASTLARRWNVEAREIRRRVDRKSGRGSMDRTERRAALAEARALTADARRHVQGVQEAILARAPVVCATAAGADVRVLDGVRFDRVVLDEATQAPDPMALVALLRAPRIVMAGDPQQLPPTILDPAAARAALGTTLFERIAGRCPDGVRLLDVQHRMHATLMAFPSAQHYGGRLRAHPSVAGREFPAIEDLARPAPLLFLDTAGRGWDEERSEDDPSTKNPEQAARVAEEVQRILARGVDPSDVGVITPYEAQARLLRELLASERAAGLEVGTVDGFQGREKECIVVDLVRSNPDAELGFLGDVRRMNVALTRARSMLLVVGDSATLSPHPYYARFLEGAPAWISAWE
jgi:ATP-dependent RNA/DNA helicase IGHMBP2